MPNECKNCDSDHCDVCGVAQKAQKEGRSYGPRQERRIGEGYGESPEQAFLESGDNTY